MAKTSNMTISRAFDHKAFGRIGIVEMTAEVGEVKIGDKVLPATSVEYLLTFALQNLQDAYAGAESADDAKGRWGKKLDRLIDGTIGVRAAGDGASAETRMRRTVLGEMLRKSQAGKDAWKAHEADRDAWLDEVFDKQSDDKKAGIMATVAERIEEAKARAKQAAELADGIEL